MQELILFLKEQSGTSGLMLGLLVLLMLVELLRYRRKATQLSPREATQQINHENAVVIDLRPSALFAEGHIIDAISLPFAEFAEKSKKLEKMKNRPLILVCAKGFDSAKAAAALKKQGFNIQTLGGGLTSWTQADLPLVKGS